VKKATYSAVIAASVMAVSTVASARDYISIVGSSTVYPFSTVVAERFGKTTDFDSPKVESTGSGGGLKLFCSGVGESTPDITNASRAIKSSEIELCASNGVTEIKEVLVGYDGIVMANANESAAFSLSRKDVFLALAKQVPNAEGKLVDNPYTTWNEVNSSLPAIKIEVLGPPPTSGTRDAFSELAMEAGAAMVDSLAKLKSAAAGPETAGVLMALGIPASVATAYEAKNGVAPAGSKIFTQVAHAVREDGVFIEAGENDNLIVQKLVANPIALGIFGFSFLEENADKVKGAMIDGTAPTFEAIASSEYPVSRPLYFYVKEAHVGTIPGMQEYVDLFLSEAASGEEGYLLDRGLIPVGVGETRVQFIK
jgi:phosphate transport system substrate-binding protein